MRKEGKYLGLEGRKCLENEQVQKRKERSEGERRKEERKKERKEGRKEGIEYFDRKKE